MTNISVTVNIGPLQHTVAVWGMANGAFGVPTPTGHTPPPEEEQVIVPLVVEELNRRGHKAKVVAKDGALGIRINGVRFWKVQGAVRHDPNTDPIQDIADSILRNSR